MESNVRLGQSLFLRAGDLSLDQLVEVGQLRRLVEANQIRLDHARSHQVYAGQQHAIDVQERFDARRVLLLEKFPLRFRETEVMMSVMPGDALRRRFPSIRVFRRRVDDQRREHLFQHVTVLLQHQAEELLGVVRHQVDFQAVVHARLFDCLVACLQADDFLQRQQMDAAQVEVRIRRRKAV